MNMNAMPSCTPTGRGFRRNWNRRTGRGGVGCWGAAADWEDQLSLLFFSLNGEAKDTGQCITGLDHKS
jgi:hypothetical protein